MNAIDLNLGMNQGHIYIIARVVSNQKLLQKCVFQYMYIRCNCLRSGHAADSLTCYAIDDLAVTEGANRKGIWSLVTQYQSFDVSKTLHHLVETLLQMTGMCITWQLFGRERKKYK